MCSKFGCTSFVRAKVALDLSKKLIELYVWLIVTDTIYYVLLVSYSLLKVLIFEKDIVWMALNFTVRVHVGLTGGISFYPLSFVPVH